ncbi:MAG TPA: GAF domain-containing sensor histidine kinase [Candidatus Limnocylindria bacterium]|nr:GAF domain-containing sensor histidine kinase [Candidatus Limnocylindria bacterium]
MDAQTSSVLAAVVQAVADASGFAAVLSRICAAVVGSLPCERATIYAWSRRARAFLPRADCGTPPHVAERFVTRGFAFGSSALVAALAAGRPFALHRADAEPDDAALLDAAELGALYGVPLLASGAAEGALVCGWSPASVPAAEALAELERVARHVALLVRNARLEADTARLAARRTWLASWAAHVLAAEDVLQVGALLDGAARELFRASGAWLLLLEGDALVGRAVSGPECGAERVRIPLAEPSASADAVRSGRLLVVNDYARSAYAARATSSRFRPASVLVVPLRDGGGPLGAVLLHDDSHRKRFGPTDEEDARLVASIATAALRKVLLVEALTRASHAKSDFLASVSHDLRTPLNIITGYAQLLQEGTFGPVTDEQADVLARIVRTVGDQVTLINDLLDLARIEQGALRCTPAPVALVELVPGLEEMMDVLLRDRPVRFEIDVPPDVVVLADRERVRQVLVNLLANAAKFTQEGCVRLVAACTDGDVAVSVSDTGPGIAPALRSRVVEPFVHGDSPAAGSGLGLAIVSRLLAAMHGGLQIESGELGGTRVEVRLPRAPGQPADESR